MRCRGIISDEEFFKLSMDTTLDTRLNLDTRFCSLLAAAGKHITRQFVVVLVTLACGRSKDMLAWIILAQYKIMVAHAGPPREFRDAQIWRL